MPCRQQWGCVGDPADVAGWRLGSLTLCGCSLVVVGRANSLRGRAAAFHAVQAVLVLPSLLFPYNDCLGCASTACTVSKAVARPLSLSSPPSTTLQVGARPPVLSLLSPQQSLSKWLIAMPQSMLGLTCETDRPEPSHTCVLQGITVQRTQPWQCTGMCMAATCWTQWWCRVNGCRATINAGCAALKFAGNGHGRLQAVVKWRCSAAHGT